MNEANTQPKTECADYAPVFTTSPLLIKADGLGMRLQQERRRLGIQCPELAQICRMSAQTQRDYEADRRRPKAAYWCAVQAVGLDVYFIRTGQRLHDGAAPTMPALPAIVLEGMAWRIRQERLRLGLSQPRFARVFGVSLDTMKNHEYGTSYPKLAALAAAAAQGVDVCFILTGTRVIQGEQV